MAPRRSGRRRAWLLALPAVAMAACSQGGLQPEGAEAERIFWVYVALVSVGSIVALAVLVAWAWGTVRGGTDTEDGQDPRAEHVPDSRLQRRFVIGGGVVLPAIVLAGFFVVQIVTAVAQAPPSSELQLDITGHQFWWEVAYHGVDGVEDFETANQIHVPTDTDITVELHSTDVIHSFWVPQLAGKLDMVPGRVNQFTFSANEPGVYAGYCAEYCGLQHAWMKFEVVAMEPSAFRQWARGQAQPAAEPDTELQQRGRAVFLGNSCVGCHSIRGVGAAGEIGPDLTHLASRDEIGAGVMPLTPETLESWIANAQAIKPGVRMPPQQLSDAELDALVAYLLSLE